MSLKFIAKQGDQSSAEQTNAAADRRRGRKPRPITEFPEPLTADWIESESFHEALSLHVSRHGDSICHLHKALTHQGVRVERSTLLQWAAGNKIPRSVRSLAILARVERRYRLPPGYFQAKLPIGARAATGHGKLRGIAVIGPH